MTTPTTAPTVSPREEKAMLDIINSMGLGELWGAVYELLLDGFDDADTILRLISNDSSPAGKKYQDALFRRFPAMKIQREENQRRAARGLPPIAEMSASTYVAEERAYIEAVSDTDPSLASAENITAWLTGAGDINRPVSPNEVRARIEVARQYMYSPQNETVRNQLRDIYGLSDSEMLKYVLSNEREREQLSRDFEMNMRRANVGAQAANRGLGLSRSLRDEIAQADSGFSYGDTASRFANVERDADTYAKLSAMSGVNTDRDDLIREEFDLAGGVSTTKLKKRLASQERARFSGSSAVGNNSLRVSGIGSQ
jgi:hypothetical protein